MEDKHTPGPWFAVEYAGYWNMQSERFYTDEGDLLDEEHTAAAGDNAKLAAAAPDLLAAARIAISSLLNRELGYEELRAAIEKATL